MSDNLKVAKECGATELGDQSYYTGLEWKDCPRLVFSGDVLEAYTSRILASQQAEHDAEIARLKEEMRALRTECAGYMVELIGANEQLEPLLAQVAMLTNMFQSVWSVIPKEVYFSQDTIDSTNAKLANAQSAAEQFIAECEQRGAVKALEDAASDRRIHYIAACNLRIIAEELRATSKKAGMTIHDQIAAARAEVATWPETVKRATDINGLR